MAIVSKLERFARFWRSSVRPASASESAGCVQKPRDVISFVPHDKTKRIPKQTGPLLKIFLYKLGILSKELSLESMQADYIVISTSLNSESKSRTLASAIESALGNRNMSVDAIDLREWPLPLCDGDLAYEDPLVGQLTEKIQAAHCILFGLPIYNFDVSASAKNLVELVGNALEGKVVGFLCAAGGHSSYMSVMSFANSLMLDFRCFILPRFVYATGDAFGQSRIRDIKIQQRIDRLAAEAIRITSALTSTQPVSK